MSDKELLASPFPPPGFVVTNSQVDGIDVYKPAPQTEQEPRAIVEFQCPQCGGKTAYSILDGGLECSYCGFVQAAGSDLVGTRAQESEFTLRTMEQSGRGWGAIRRELECQNCGVHVSIPSETLTHTCAFCGSNKVIQQTAEQQAIRPAFMIPFKLDRDQCHQIARAYLGDSWMIPPNLRGSAAIEGFNPVYLSYWTFDADLQAQWQAEVGHTVSEQYYDHSDRTWKTRMKTEWRWEKGQVQLHSDDLLVPGTRRLSTLHLDKISNFTLSQLTPYEPNFLAGFNAQAYEVTLEAAWEEARQRMRENARKECRGQASSSQIRNFSMNLDFSDELWRYILLPVYIAAYQFAGKTYQLLVNGQSGEISGQRPVDWKKVWLAMAALLLPGVVLSILGLLTLPIAGIGVILGGAGGLLLLVGLVISIIIAVQASRMDDA